MAASAESKAKAQSEDADPQSFNPITQPDLLDRAILRRSPSRLRSIVLGTDRKRSPDGSPQPTGFVGQMQRGSVFAVTVDGMIGAGKSTVISLLAKLARNGGVDAITFHESGQEGGVLDKWLADRSALVAMFQMWMYAECVSRTRAAEQIKRVMEDVMAKCRADSPDIPDDMIPLPPKLVLVDRTPEGNSWFALANHFGTGMLHGGELDFYMTASKARAHYRYGASDVNLVLSVTPETSMRRMFSRGNSCERKAYKSQYDYFWWLKVFETLSVMANLTASETVRHPQLVVDWNVDEEKEAASECIQRYFAHVLRAQNTGAYARMRKRLGTAKDREREEGFPIHRLRILPSQSSPHRAASGSVLRKKIEALASMRKAYGIRIRAGENAHGSDDSSDEEGVADFCDAKQRCFPECFKVSVPYESRYATPQCRYGCQYREHGHRFAFIEICYDAGSEDAKAGAGRKLGALRHFDRMFSDKNVVLSIMNALAMQLQVYLFVPLIGPDDTEIKLFGGAYTLNVTPEELCPLFGSDKTHRIYRQPRPPTAQEPPKIDEKDRADASAAPPIMSM